MPTLNERARRVARLGTVAAVAGGGIAALPVTSDVALAGPWPTNYGCSLTKINACYITLAQTGSDIDLAGGTISILSGTCNLALYAGQSVNGADRVYQTPVKSCVKYGAHSVDTGISPKSGEWYTAAFWWHLPNGATELTYISDPWPFSNDCPLGC